MRLISTLAGTSIVMSEFCRRIRSAKIVNRLPRLYAWIAFLFRDICFITKHTVCKYLLLFEKGKTGYFLHSDSALCVLQTISPGKKALLVSRDITIITLTEHDEKNRTTSNLSVFVDSQRPNRRRFERLWTVLFRRDERAEGRRDEHGFRSTIPIKAKPRDKDKQCRPMDDGRRRAWLTSILRISTASGFGTRF